MGLPFEEIVGVSFITVLLLNLFEINYSLSWVRTLFNERLQLPGKMPHKC